MVLSALSLARRLALLPLLLCLLAFLPARAEVQRSKLLDTAFQMLEKDNIFQRRYNEITGAQVTSLFETGLPYFFGGRPNDTLMSQYPDFAKRYCWESTSYYKKNKVYIYGLDCTGYITWLRRESGLDKMPTAGEILNEKKYRGNDLYCGGWNWKFPEKPMPEPQELHKFLQVGDVLVMRSKYRHVMLYIGTLRDYGFTAEEVPELAEYLDYPLGIHCSSHPRYAPVIQDYIDARPDYCRNCITTDGGVNVSILYVPPEAAPYHEYVQVTLFDYFLIDEGQYQLTIRPTDNLRAFTWYRP